MNQTAGELIRVGTSGARIVRVTQKRIEYIDMAGQDQFIDLEECARAWGRWHDVHSHEFFPVPRWARWHDVHSHELLPIPELFPGPPSRADIDAGNADVSASAAGAILCGGPSS